MARIPILLILLGMVIVSISPIVIAKDIDGQMTGVTWPSKSTYSYSESVPVNVNFVNTGSQGFSFWVGYSVQDASGKWWDAPAQQTAFVQPGSSGSIQLNWQPTNIAPQGAYIATVALWTGYNSNTGLMYGELDRRTKNAAFWLDSSGSGGSCSVWTDKPSYHVGEQVHFSYSVGTPTTATLTLYPPNGNPIKLGPIWTSSNSVQTPMNQGATYPLGSRVVTLETGSGCKSTYTYNIIN